MKLVQVMVILDFNDKISGVVTKFDDSTTFAIIFLDRSLVLTLAKAIVYKFTVIFFFYTTGPIKANL